MRGKNLSNRQYVQCVHETYRGRNVIEGHTLCRPLVLYTALLTASCWWPSGVITGWKMLLCSTIWDHWKRNAFHWRNLFIRHFHIFAGWPVTVQSEIEECVYVDMFKVWQFVTLYLQILRLLMAALLIRFSCWFETSSDKLQNVN